jgi:hypothetical protein
VFDSIDRKIIPMYIEFARPCVYTAEATLVYLKSKMPNLLQGRLNGSSGEKNGNIVLVKHIMFRVNLDQFNF